MEPRTITALVLLVNALVLGLFDIYMIARYGGEASISLVMYDLAREYPILAFLIGGVCFHWFWPVK
jgi:hypothetical protein